MKCSVLILFLVLCGALSAQNEGKIETLKREYITKNLELTSQEAEKFFPIYSEYEQKRQALRKESKQLASSATATMDQRLNQRQDLLNLDKEYLVKFKTVLPDAKIAKLPQVEHDFKKILLERLRD